jgi:protein-S-isoprenylcysteine O-methyltransferase Ste14
MSDRHLEEPGAGAKGTSSAPEERRSGTGTWVGYVIFALVLLFLLIFDVQAAVQRQWVNFTGITLFTLAFAVIPTGGAKWLRRSVRDRKPSGRRHNLTS